MIVQEKEKGGAVEKKRKIGFQLSCAKTEIIDFFHTFPLKYGHS